VHAAARPMLSTRDFTHDAVSGWLDATTRRLLGPQAGVAFQDMIADLWSLRRAVSQEAWRSLIARMRDHELAGVVWQDPFLDHAFRRPRGYPGDAALLDWIYEGTAHPDAPDPHSVGGRIFRMSVHESAPGGVRWRRDHIAARLAALGRGARVMSLAAGHLREARLVAASGSALPRIDALDQDLRSLAEIDGSLSEQPVQTWHAGVREVLNGTWEPQRTGYDLVYAAGLYDYLNDDIAAALNARLVERTAVGGTTLVANFLPDVRGVGIMEAFMDWHLIYRTGAQLEATFRSLGDAVSLETYVGPCQNVVYTAATRLRP